MLKNTIPYAKTMKGIITKIYAHQKENSIKRGHKPPTYSKREFSEWMFCNPLFHTLYARWLDSNYKKDLIPSVDRKDNKKGYSFSNIELMTWKENSKKADVDQRNGYINSPKPIRAVYKYNKMFKRVDEFISISEAERETGISNSNISQCCQGKRKSAGGFMWRYKC